MCEDALGRPVLIGDDKRPCNLVDMATWSDFDAEILQVGVEEVGVGWSVSRKVDTFESFLHHQRLHGGLVRDRCFVYFLLDFLLFACELFFLFRQCCLECADVDHCTAILPQALLSEFAH